MVVDDVMHLHASDDSTGLSGRNSESTSNLDNADNGHKKVGHNVDEGVFIIEDLGQEKEGNQGSNTGTTDLNQDVNAQPPIQNVNLVEFVSVSRCTKVDDQDSSVVEQREEVGVTEMDGLERSQAVCHNKESSVRVLYSSLPRRSKRKLEELLHDWSEWHAKHCTSAEDPVGSLESGEETYFPALHVGSDRPSTVSFSMDIHVRKRKREASSLIDNDYSPLYNRGYAIGLSSKEGVSEDSTRDLREVSRCFNCSSYNHSLSECSKPRNNAAVNSARKQFLSNKKSLSAGPRVPTRYYQESPGGKFDGLKPGALSAETRELLGLTELDPPPWLNRMRELGYPPGYLDQEEDQPSGITIFGDDETQNRASENGLTVETQKSQKKMIVVFPGINGPIPENADQERWIAPAPRGPEFPWNQIDINRQQYARDPMSNGHFYGEYRPRNHIQSPSYHFGLGSSPPLSHHPYNYYPNDPFSPRGIPIPSPNYGRSPDVGRPFLHYNYGSF